MDSKPISQGLKNIVEKMSDLIAEEKTERLREDTGGWLYGGQTFMGLVKDLKTEMENQGFNIYSCAVRHFFKGANILDLPTKELLIIPINGVATLSPGGQLIPDTYCSLKDQPTLSGNNIDVIIVILEKGRAET
ncbi:uncharacterized protein ACHE_10950S [Aspergillus chevalieri]|uniref:Uncharacterized protein n=1 Tax=Aspergillus chevalieri TaxID=182096 RepID=A0A7R7VF41_ASPCH|nr:uncharacterized protein ACHE_10950S [Aspergillus chevalieri]BCR83548.1 hypothetical protein ACHE_10950S [Aspergillus chevalieri]